MENQSKVITITKVETKMFDSGASQYKLTGDGQTFKFYDKRKDGEDSVAYKQFKDLELKVGSTVSVWYKEEQKEYEGKPYTDRMIASFRETNEKPVQKQTYTPTKEQEPTDWDEIAVGKCQSLFIAAFLQSGKTFSEAKLQVTQARQLAELVVYGQQKEVAVGKDMISGEEFPLPDEVGF